MKLYKFLGILAASIGLVGAVFLVIGTLSLTNKNIMDSMFHFAAIGWPSTEMITSKTTLLADTKVGFVGISLAFLIQIVAICIPDRWRIGKAFWSAVITLCLIMAILIVIFIFCDSCLRNFHESNVKKLIVKDYLTRKLEREPVDPTAHKGLAALWNEYFGLKKEESDTKDKEDFIKKVAEDVGWTVPQDVDFSRIDL